MSDSTIREVATEPAAASGEIVTGERCPDCGRPRRTPDDDYEGAEGAVCSATWFSRADLEHGGSIRACKDLCINRLRFELAAIRELCLGSGCSDPGPACADQTLAMAEELRQRGVCASNHGESSEHQARLAEAERGLVDAALAWADGGTTDKPLEYAIRRVQRALRAKDKTNGD